MRKLFVALLIILNSFTNTTIPHSVSKNNIISKKTLNIVDKALKTTTSANKYLLQNFKTKTTDLPISFPLDIKSFKRISDYYGNRVHPVLGIKTEHHGLDISGQFGSPIYPAADGIVKSVKRAYGYGKLITVDHGNNIITYYGHLNKVLVKVGDKIKTGDKIAELGNSGMSTGPHLHFEIRVNGNSIDPVKLMFTYDSRDEKLIIEKMLNQSNFKKWQRKTFPQTLLLKQQSAHS